MRCRRHTGLCSDMPPESQGPVPWIRSSGAIVTEERNCIASTASSSSTHFTFGGRKNSGTWRSSSVLVPASRSMRTIALTPATPSGGDAPAPRRRLPVCLESERQPSVSAHPSK